VAPSDQQRLNWLVFDEIERVSPPKAEVRNVELDVMRALAVIFMVINHAGFKLLSPNDAVQGWAGAWVFLGSFAPVLFFFITGLGAGLAKGASTGQGGAPEFWPMANKVLLLFLADAFLSLQGGSLRWQFDFFAFIGMCVVAVWLVQQTHRRLIVALIAIAALLAMRYVLAPLAYKFGWTSTDSISAKILAWCLGMPGVDGFSYLIAPWLVYPLAGFVLGSWYGKAPRFARKRAEMTALLAVAIALSASAAAYLMGASFLRWSTMSVAFFVLSVAVLGLTCLTAFFLVRRLPRMGNLLSMSGVSAFAAVPVHYALLEILKPVLTPMTPHGYLPAAIGLLTLTLLIAHGVDLAVRSCRGAADVPLVGSGLLALGVIAATIVLLRAPHYHAIAGCLGQLVVVALFGWRYRLLGAGRVAH